MEAYALSVITFFIHFIENLTSLHMNRKHTKVCIETLVCVVAATDLCCGLRSFRARPATTSPRELLVPQPLELSSFSLLFLQVFWGFSSLCQSAKSELLPSCPDTFCQSLSSVTVADFSYYYLLAFSFQNFYIFLLGLFSSTIWQTLSLLSLKSSTTAP